MTTQLNLQETKCSKVLSRKSSESNGMFQEKDVYWKLCNIPSGEYHKNPVASQWISAVYY
jgi:hypothetical protein